MSRGNSPPRLAGRVARWLLSAENAERLIEALDDEYVHYRLNTGARLTADLWYWGQVLRSLRPLRRTTGEGASAGSLLRDLVHLSRSLRRHPASPLAAILTLTVALGAGTAVFSVVDAVIMKPLPFDDPDALFVLGETQAEDPGAPVRRVDVARLDSWRERAQGLATLEGYDRTTLTLTGSGPAERISAADVTAGFLSLLGAAPARGRSLTAADAGQPVAIISHRFWHNRMGADAGVLGSVVVLNGRAHSIVGVLPEAFHFPLDPADVWRPVALPAADGGEQGYRLRIIARLAPGGSADDLVGRLEEASRSSTTPMPARAIPLATAVSGDSRVTLGLLAAAAGLAMLLAFMNFAVLLVVRSLDRRREMAVRRALGAGQAEAARQLILEALVLASLGLGGGVALALWLTPLVASSALELGGLADLAVSVSWRAAALVGTAAIAAALAGGILSVLGTNRRNGMDALRSRIPASFRDRRARRVFVTGEVALALVLLVSMAITGLSLLDVLRENPGFEPDGVVKLQVSLPTTRYETPDAVTRFYATAQRNLEERLGGGTVSTIDELPLTGDGGRASVASRDGTAQTDAAVRAAGPGYFGLMDIPLISGRGFGFSDDGAGEARAVISESLRRALFGGERPVGRHVTLAGLAQPLEVVGVVGDVKHRTLEEPPLPTLYVSSLQVPSASSVLVVRSTLPDATVIAIVRSEIQGLDPDLPVYSISSMSDVVSASPGVPTRRILTAMLGGFAALAVVLAAIGVFGVTAHELASRRTEFALRMALGAQPVQMFAVPFRSVAGLVGWGVVCGGLLSVWAADGLRATVFDPGAPQLLRIGLAAAALVVTTGAVAVLPVALRAARSEPRDALQGD